ncbi:MAG: branched-chain amino acid aminotransferase [Cytophagaceae bacterium]|nr:branched-chain amino acid aminotransferase [Cytophagaceae bacterium]
MIDTLLEINPVAQSRISTVDFDNLQFGRTFADHMFMADYADGQWQNLQILPYQTLQFSPALMTLHYGQAIFEGMKAYKNEAGDITILRPLKNWARMNKSAARMCMPELPEEVFMGGLTELLRLDAAWVPSAPGCSLYIRPFMFATDEYVGVAPSKTYKFLIINSPVGTYYSKPVKLRIETHYVRAAKGGVGFAKNAGNYGGSLLPAKLAQDAGYDQIIWTDHKEHRYVEEAGTMNLMFVIDGKLVTAPISDTILDGVTRDTILTIARDWRMPLEERPVSVDELIEGISSGRVQEAFGAGTAAVVSPMYAIGHEGTDYALPEITADSFARRVYRELDDLKLGRKTDTRNWVYKV